MAKKNQAQPRITAKEKEAPAYIKKVEAENNQLKASLESTQNQSAILQQRCTDLEKDNSVLNERLRGSGFQSTFKDLCILVGGAGISYFVESKFQTASMLLLLAFVAMGVYWLISNFRNR